jgi:hypothetical protein
MVSHQDSPYDTYDDPYPLTLKLTTSEEEKTPAKAVSAT